MLTHWPPLLYVVASLVFRPPPCGKASNRSLPPTTGTPGSPREHLGQEGSGVNTFSLICFIYIAIGFVSNAWFYRRYSDLNTESADPVPSALLFVTMVVTWPYVCWVERASVFR